MSARILDNVKYVKETVIKVKNRPDRVVYNIKLECGLACAIYPENNKEYIDLAKELVAETDMDPPKHSLIWVGFKSVDIKHGEYKVHANMVTDVKLARYVKK